MRRFYTENVIVLSAGIAIAFVAVALPDKGSILHHTFGMVLGVFVTFKGSAKLRCAKSDVLLAAAIFVFVLLSKVVPPNHVSPTIFESCALVLFAVYWLTGLKFKAIAMEQRGRRTGQPSVPPKPTH